MEGEGVWGVAVTGEEGEGLLEPLEGVRSTQHRGSRAQLAGGDDQVDADAQQRDHEAGPAGRCRRR